MISITEKEKTLILKDISETWSDNFCRRIILFVPLLLSLLIPFSFVAAISLIQSGRLDIPHEFINMIRCVSDNVKVSNFCLLVNEVFPIIFLFIPLVCSSVMSSCIFSGEKNRHTINSLVLTTLSKREIIKSKVICSIFINFIIVILSFIFISITILMGCKIFNIEYKIDFLFFFCEAFTSFFIMCTNIFLSALLSMKKYRYMESFQTCSYFAVMISIIIIAEFLGFITNISLAIFLFGLFLALLSGIFYFIIKMKLRKMQK